MIPNAWSGFDFGLGEDPRRVTSLAGAEKVLTFSMSGLSKIAGLPQMKLGWIVASEDLLGRRTEGHRCEQGYE